MRDFSANKIKIYWYNIGNFKGFRRPNFYREARGRMALGEGSGCALGKEADARAVFALKRRGKG